MCSGKIPKGMEIIIIKIIVVKANKTVPAKPSINLSITGFFLNKKFPYRLVLHLKANCHIVQGMDH